VKQRAISWQCGTRVVSLESPILVGILNVTPDSFSDGGNYENVDLAKDHALQLISDGATMIDVGGESTRPGATRISAEEQIARVQPVIEAIRRESDVCISIDTTLSKVAKSALQAGADVINDVSAGEEDQEIFTLAAETGVGLVLMHRRVPPELDQYSDAYQNNQNDQNSSDIVDEVSSWFQERVAKALSVGVCASAIALDPGLGFGKSVAQNWNLVEEAMTFVDLGYPIYMGASRKSFIGATTGIETPELRDSASVATTLEMAIQGVQIFRVHNVFEHARVLQSLPSIQYEL
jgi:dihydropteroate synthase